MSRVTTFKCVLMGLTVAWGSLASAQVAITDPPPEHHFGKIPLQANFAAQYFSVFNQGNESVTLGQATVNGGMATCSALGCPVVSPGDFVLAAGSSDGCSGRTLAPGEGCSTLIGFVPQAPGARVALLNFPVNGGATVSRVISGTGVAQPFDCVLDWAERTVPASLVAQPTPTMVISPYYARCYQGGALCVGADVAVPTFAPASVYTLMAGELKSIGLLSELAAVATQAPPSQRRCNQPTEGQ